jgi:hypothetical protein
MKRQIGGTYQVGEQKDAGGSRNGPDGRNSRMLAIEY